MARVTLEIADIFRDHGAAWRDANRGHISLGQLKVMSAIESCRTAALGGHVARCDNDTCAHTVIAYNSCGDRHCPKCHVWTAPALQEESDISAKRSGAVMYSACCLAKDEPSSQCSRIGRWP